MSLKTPAVVPIVAIQTQANQWQITGFLVRTPADGQHELAIYCEAAVTDDHGNRTDVTPLALSRYIGQEIEPVLADVGRRALALMGVPIDPAITDQQLATVMYTSMRDALYALKRAEGVVPQEAT